MRLWSLHPKYLDAKGLIALWREALLAKHVLEGKTKGYKHHPQLVRFKQTTKPVDSINQYLSEVYQEAACRGYNFDSRKINRGFSITTMKVTRGQINYEARHLLGKLKKRDLKKYIELRNAKRFSANPMFKIVRGEIEEWEKVKVNSYK